jgi:hypothetical protein
MQSKIIQTFCTVDKKPIPPERAARRSNTCDNLCQRKLKAHRRAVQDAKKCRHCSRPSTPEERLNYQRWRRSQPEYVAKKRGRKPKNKLEPEAVPA